MGADCTAKVFSKLFGEFNAITLNHNIQIEIFCAQQKITDKPSHCIDSIAIFFRHLTDGPQENNHLLVENLDNKAVYIPVPLNIRTVII